MDLMVFLFIKDKPTVSSEGMLRKDCDINGSVVKKCGLEPLRACRQDELFGGKPPVVK
jgi:hypothetical protein